MESNSWNYQYLEDEKLHYLTEVHPEDGILGELFFETTEEFLDYTKKHNITFKGEVDAKVFLDELIVKNVEIEYDKEHGEGAFDALFNDLANILKKIDENE